MTSAALSSERESESLPERGMRSQVKMKGSGRKRREKVRTGLVPNKQRGAARYGCSKARPKLLEQNAWVKADTPPQACVTVPGTFSDLQNNTPRCKGASMLEPIGGWRSIPEQGKEEQGLVPTEWGHAQSHQTRI